MTDEEAACEVLAALMASGALTFMEPVYGGQWSLTFEGDATVSEDVARIVDRLAFAALDDPTAERYVPEER